MKPTKIATESIKIDTVQVQRVREHVVKTRETIAGFISTVVEREMDKIDKRKSKLN